MVEDCKISRDVMEELLRRQGVRITSAPGARAALTMLRPPLPDAIITDLHMPEMDGIALMDELRAHGIAVPVIACSADVSTETHRACQDAGFAAFLPKPFTGAALNETLATALESALPVLDHAALTRNAGGDAQLLTRWKAGIV